MRRYEDFADRVAMEASAVIGEAEIVVDLFSGFVAVRAQRTDVDTFIVPSAVLASPEGELRTDASTIPYGWNEGVSQRVRAIVEALFPDMAVTLEGDKEAPAELFVHVSHKEAVRLTGKEPADVDLAVSMLNEVYSVLNYAVMPLAAMLARGAQKPIDVGEAWQAGYLGEESALLRTLRGVHDENPVAGYMLAAILGRFVEEAARAVAPRWDVLV